MRFSIYLLMILAVSCGGGNANLPSLPESSLSDRNQGSLDQLETEQTLSGAMIIEPSPNHYAKQFHEKMLLAQNNTPEQAALIYLNFDGGEVSTEYLRSVGLDCRELAKLSASSIEKAEQRLIVDDLIKNSKKQVRVTLVKPFGSSYSTIYIGGSAEELDCQGVPDHSAVAISDPGNIISSDVGFVYESDLSVSKRNIKTVLDSMIDNNQFVYSNFDQLSQEQIKRYESLSAALPELNQGDLVDLAPLDDHITTVVPEKLRPMFGLARLTTVVSIAGQEENRIDIAKSKTVLSTVVVNSAGVISAIASLAGAPEVGIAISLVKNLFGGGATRSEPVVTSLPSFDELLDLKPSQTSIAELMRQFDTHLFYLDQKYPNSTELRTLAVIGFLQAIPKAQTSASLVSR